MYDLFQNQIKKNTFFYILVIIKVQNPKFKFAEIIPIKIV